MSPIRKQAETWMRPLEAAYSLAFLVFLVSYIVGTVLRYQINLPSSSAGEISPLYILVVAILLSLQLLRMYYHLHEFDHLISDPNSTHFLESLPDKHGQWERVLRMLMALSLILATKLSDVRIAANVSGVIPSFALALCFILLLLWDYIVWCGINDPSNTLKSDAWLTFRQFFYISKDQTDKAGLKPYYCHIKFYERVAGLLGATSALLYAFWPRVVDIPYICLIFALFVVALTIIGLLFSGQKFSRVKDFLTLPIVPLLAFYDIFKGDSSMQRTRKQYIGAATVLVLLIVSIIVIRSFYDSTGNQSTPVPDPRIMKPDSSRQPTSVRIATSKNLWCALTLIAQEKNYFLQEGLKTELNIQAAGRLNMDALLGGTVDIANVVETNIAYQALNHTGNLAIHGRIVSATDYAILTKGSSNIRSAGDLRGKGLAYAQSTGAESFVFWFLEKEGIPKANIKLIPLQPAGIVDHFLAGKTDAVATWEPFVSTIRKRSTDLGRVFYAETGGFTGIMVVATRRDWAETNPSVVRAYDNAMKKASRFVVDSLSLAQKIISEQTGLPLETVSSAWQRFDFNYVPTSERELRLVQDVVRRIQVMVPDMQAREPEDVHIYFGK